jgi:iron complex transport system substrate-binding protein
MNVLRFVVKSFFVFMFTVLFSCKSNSEADMNTVISGKELISYASGLSIQDYETFKIVTVSNPWTGAKEPFTYICYSENTILPDSLHKYQAIQIPVKSIVVTSTTHIPPLELLGVEKSLIAFPNTDYISSEKTRALIDSGLVREIGSNQALNTEVLLDLNPDVIMGFGVDGEKSTYDNLQRNGIKVVYNGDWTEQNALGRAEWIKFFGVLFDKILLAETVFSEIEKDYKNAQTLVENISQKPTILSGAIYENHWYLPQGKSWAAMFLKEAGGDYIWKETEGTGSLSLTFETVFDKAENADFWIGPGQFTSINEILKANPNYKHFKAVQTGNVFSFSSKRGKTGGVIYYELASSRPDLVLKDLIKILHPEILHDYELSFFEHLKTK